MIFSSTRRVLQSSGLNQSVPRQAVCGSKTFQKLALPKIIQEVATIAFGTSAGVGPIPASCGDLATLLGIIYLFQINFIYWLLNIKAIPQIICSSQQILSEISEDLQYKEVKHL